MLFELLALSEGIHQSPVYSFCKVSVIQNFYNFIFCYHVEAAEQRFELPVIWDVRMFVWHSHNRQDFGSDLLNKDLYKDTISVVLSHWHPSTAPVTTRTTRTLAFWRYPPTPHDYPILLTSLFWIPSPYYWPVNIRSQVKTRWKPKNKKNLRKIEILEFCYKLNTRHTL